MTPLDAAAAVVLLEFQHSYGLGFVAPNGRIVTCFHVVADEPQITAHLADGRILPVQSVCAVDSRRDLAVLDVGLLDVKPVKAPETKLALEGQAVFIFGMVAGEGRARWVDAELSSVQVVGASLTVYTLSGDVPADASGGPMVATDGVVLGVVTVAKSDEGIATLAVPWKYVEPLLLQHLALPLSALSVGGRKPLQRQVPHHGAAVFEGCSLSSLILISEIITEAIRVGASVYNGGDRTRCFAIYEQTARKLIESCDDCSGAQTALRAGLARASSMPDVDNKAWAMRDAFDGLLLAIEKYMRVKGGAVKKPSKPTLLN